MGFTLMNIDFDALISNEVDDSKMYRQAALRVSDLDSESANVFLKIAEEEFSHASKIRAIRDRLMQKVAEAEGRRFNA